MGVKRNGARTFLNILWKACKLSRLPGFETGIRSILRPVDAGNVLNGWITFCSIIDGIVAVDNWYNQKDHEETEAEEGSEDAPMPA